MPSSRVLNIKPIYDILCQHKPNSVLDIGIGTGMYGFLIRNYLEHQIHLYDDWKIRLDGIEAFSEYITPVQQYLYDKIIRDDVLNVVDDLDDYDLILMIDVLEHFEKQIGVELVKKLQKKCKCLLVVVPSFDYKQGEVFGNKFEVHKCCYGKKELVDLGFKVDSNVHSFICFWCH